MTKKQIKAKIEKIFGSEYYKAVCLTERKVNENIHYEWVIICKISNVVEALFCMTDTCVYQIKYISGTTPAEKIVDLRNELKANKVN